MLCPRPRTGFFDQSGTQKRLKTHDVTKLTDNNALSASACRIILAWMPWAPEGTVLLWLRRRLADLFMVTVGGREVYPLSRAPSLLPP